MSSIYWLASYPKSGNTWFRAFLQNLLVDGETPVEINELSTGSIASGRSWLDETLGFDTADLTENEIDVLRPEVYNWEKDAADLAYHKIHDAYTLTALAEPLVGAKGTRGALYIVRNPLDIAPSYANHCHCSIDQAIENMADAKHCMAKNKKRLNSQVRQQLLSWSSHVRSWLEAPELIRLIIRYEDMLYNPEETFTRACRFLELPLDNTRIAKAIAFSDFKELAKQESANGFKERPVKTDSFFRQGKSGDWQNKLSAEQVDRIIADHGEMMRCLGYLNEENQPLVVPKPIDESCLTISTDDKHVVELETKRFNLRPITNAEINEVYIGWWNDERIQAGLGFSARGWQRQQVLRHHSTFNNKTRFHLGVFRKGGSLVGFVSLLPSEKEKQLELIMVVGDKDFWGKRVPDEVLPVLFSHFFGRFVEVFYCQVRATNRSSIAGLNRLGFSLDRVEKDGRKALLGGRVDIQHFSLSRVSWLARQQCEVRS